MVAIDEAHLFAPFGGQSTVTTPVRKAATGAIVDLMSRGRKRGLAGVLATQLARLKSVVSEVHNFLLA
jgi:DNA helicase HerA-like ATPase